MGDITMADDVCIECGRPLDGDDDDLCVSCLRDLDNAIRQKFKPNLTEDRDGKRLAKSKRPKRKPTPERDRIIPEPPKTPHPERETTTGQRPVRRPQRQTDGRSSERR